MLRMIAGLEDITHGDVKIGERRLTIWIRQARRGDGVSKLCAFPHKSVLENMRWR